MAVIDEEQGHLVVRVVYDGPALSGKTTSLRTLAKGLGATVHSPEEHEGRTLYFDWVDYVGGLFDGRQIHCQILSVPGQLELAPRRNALLRSADVVVLVADTRRSEFATSVTLLELNAQWCRSQTPPVGMVFQANKRDDPDSVSREELLETVRKIAPIPVVETIATEGDGVRESFVFAVRLALDRVRALANAGVLPTTERSIESADEVEAQLSELAVNSIVEAQASDVESTRGPDALATEHVFDDSVAEAEVVMEHEASHVQTPVRPRISFSTQTSQRVVERPFRPDPHMPGGLIWPPVDGRALLHEIAEHGLTPHRTTPGDWAADALGWCCRSGSGQYYAGLERGREALIRSARLHVSHAQWISGGRIVVLADAGESHYRLWQLFRSVPTLANTLMTLGPEDSVAHVIRSYMDVGRDLLIAQERFTSAGLPCTIQTVSATGTRFTGSLDEATVEGCDVVTPDEILLSLVSPFQDLCQSFSDLASLERALLRADVQGEKVASILLNARF